MDEKDSCVNMTTEHYAEHVRELQRRAEEALAATDYEGLVVHSGTPLRYFADDNDAPFQVNNTGSSVAEGGTDTLRRRGGCGVFLCQQGRGGRISRKSLGGGPLYVDPENPDWQFELGQSHFWLGYSCWEERDLGAAIEQFDELRF